MKVPSRHLYVSAFEPSADQYLAGVLKSLHAKDPGLKISGVGGVESRRSGLKPLFNAEELTVMGLIEVIRSLPKVWTRLREIKSHLRSNPPDVALLIDYPGLHFALLPTLRSLGTRIVYFIPPKVWVWRKRRIQVMKKFIDLVLCIFPFEKEFFEKEGLPVSYVGNPLLDQLPLSLTRNDARAKLGLGSEAKVLAVLPGSRKQEIEFHIEVMSRAALRFQEQTGTQVYFSFPDQFSETQRQVWVKRIHEILPQAQVGWGDAHLLMRASDYGLIKSGTSTLEAALLGLKHVVVYRLNPITCFLLRHVFHFRQFAGLSNIILDYQALKPAHFEERLCGEVTEQNLFESMIKLHESQELKFKQERAISMIREKMQVSGSPTERVADALVKELIKGRSRTRSFSWVKFIAAHLWNRVHAVRKYFSKPRKLPTRVISIGNYQMGGTGKTPFVLEILAQAQKRGKRVWVLTRGYQSSSESHGSVILPDTQEVSAEMHGDETVMIHQKYPEVPIGVGRDRWSSYQRLKQHIGHDPEWVVLDDGGQNLQISKDVEIMLMTSHQVGEVWYRQIPNSRPHSKELRIYTKGSFNESVIPQATLQTVWRQNTPLLPLYLVSGIADPDQLKDSIESLGLKVQHHEVFKDHTYWDHEKVKGFIAQAEKRGLVLTMTAKDFTRVSEESLKRAIFVVDTEVKWVSGESLFQRALD